MLLKTLDNSAEVIDFFKHVGYGNNYFIYKSKNLYREIKEQVDIINAFFSANKLVIKEEIDQLVIDQNYWNRLGSIYSVVSSIENNELPSRENDCFKLREAFHEAFNTQDIVRVNVGLSVAKFAKTIATSKVSFEKDSEGYYFNGKEKEVSIYKKIENAFYDNDPVIDFDLKEVSSGTIRCYASTLSAASGVKIKCSVTDGIITVFLKPLTKQEKLHRDAVHLFNKYDLEEKSIDVLESMIKSYRDMYSNNEVDEGVNTEQYDEEEF